MDAGDEMDVMIAKSIMGWHWVTNRHNAQGWASAGNGGENLTDLSAWNSWVSPCTPAFSREIESAWWVVEMLNERGWRVEIARTQTGTDVLIRRWNGLDHEGDYAEWAQTAPHAICLAALRAVGAI